MDKVEQAREFYEQHKMKIGRLFREEFLKLSKEDIYDYLDNIYQDKIHEWRLAHQNHVNKIQRLERTIIVLETNLKETQTKLLNNGK